MTEREPERERSLFGLFLLLFGDNLIYYLPLDLRILEYLNDAGSGDQRELLNPEFSKPKKVPEGLTRCGDQRELLNPSHTFSQVSALLYVLHKVKISRTFDNWLPLMVSAIVG